MAIVRIIDAVAGHEEYVMSPPLSREYHPVASLSLLSALSLHYPQAKSIRLPSHEPSPLTLLRIPCGDSLQRADMPLDHRNVASALESAKLSLQWSGK